MIKTKGLYTCMTSTCYVGYTHVHTPCMLRRHLFHGVFACLLQLLGARVDGLVQHRENLLSVLRQVVAGSQCCQRTHLGGEGGGKGGRVGEREGGKHRGEEGM